MVEKDRKMAGIERLLSVVEKLRGEGGCPWDREQTVESLKPFLIEESYEVIDAIDRGDLEGHMEELGDVLLQVVLHAQIRAEEGLFDFDRIAGNLADKLVRRHPHVFGDIKVEDSERVLSNWEKIKSEEKGGGRESVLDGIPGQLPSLQRAQRVQARAARVGFDWRESGGVVAKVEEELAEVKEAISGGDSVRIEEELGDMLFSVVNLCRFHSIDAEGALRKMTDKFARRFKEVEKGIKAEGLDIRACSLEDLDRRWEEAKAACR